jgi:hypothetical protein
MISVVEINLICSTTVFCYRKHDFNLAYS